MKRFAPYLILLVLVISTLFVSNLFELTGSTSVYAFHSEHEISEFQELAEALPNGFNSIFAASGECERCHGKAGNGPNPNALQDANGNDVSPVTDWKATMMANAAKDPFWRAKVSHEILVNPGLQQDIENTCTRCHAPNGFFNAIHNGQAHYSINDMVQDSLALDGVSCTSCHSMLPDGLGNVFSATMTYDTNKTIYGPYSNPFVNPMINSIGFTPAQGNHISTSEMCGACHTLITHAVDLSGIPTGTHFVEQAIYHEWENSDYASATQTTCQDCHVPQINDNVVISDRPPFLGARSPFGRHTLVGGNAFMLSLLKDNIDTLGLSANMTEFDTVIQRTTRQLQQKTMDLTLTETARNNDTAFYKLELTNKAGHKFPAGYPSRRSFISFLVRDDNGDTLFHSGKVDGQYRLIDEDPTYEPHYEVINDPTEVQIYEMVMGDVNSNVTTVLERAFVHLKDNRLPPVGFSSTHSNYDTVKVVGVAVADTNFNQTGAFEGTGKDHIYYHVPLNGYTGTLTVNAIVYYQPVPPKWTDDMFSYSSTEIDLFKSLYNAADHTAVKVAVASLNDPSLIEEEQVLQLEVYPNPSNEYLRISGMKGVREIKIYTITGQLVMTIPWNKTQQQQINLPFESGVYFLNVRTEKGKVYQQKFIKR